MDTAEMIRKSGLESSRDFQTGLVQEWHGQTNIVNEVTGECLPDIHGVQLYYGDDFTPMVGHFLPVSKDDNKACGKPYNVDTYSLFTPREGLDYITQILAGTGFQIQSVGMLSNRSIWFASIHLTELLALIPGHVPYVNINGSLDGKISLGGQLFVKKTVCKNTLRQSRELGEQIFRAKFTKNFKAAIDAAKKDIEKLVGMTRVFGETLKKIQAIPASENTAREIYAGFVTTGEKMTTRAKNLTGELVTLFQRGIGNRGETVEDINSGFTQARTRGLEESTKDVWSTFESSEFGSYADQKEEFFGILADDEKRETVRAKGQFLLANSN